MARSVGYEIIVNKVPVTPAPESAPRENLVAKLGVWSGLVCAAALASLLIFPPNLPAGQTCRTAFHAATAVAYLVVFFHCLVRLIYSRWPSWFFFTVGYGAMAIAGVAGVVAGSRFGQTALVRDYLDLTRIGMVPLATVVLLAAAYASRARTRGHRIGSPKTFLKMLAASAALVLGWRLGAFDILGRLIGATSINGRLAVEACSAVSLLVLIFRTRRLAPSKRDEIVVPTAYWAAAMLVAGVISVVGYETHLGTWWQVSALELAGIGSLLLGLGIANEAAHRAATEKMTDLQAMQKVSWSLVGATGVKELSSALVTAMAESFQARAVTLYIAGDSEEELVISAVHGIDDPTVAIGKVCQMKPDRRRGFHSGHTARAYASGTIQTASDIFSDVEFLPWRSVAKDDGIVVSVPLTYRCRVIGVVNLFLVGVESLTKNQEQLLRSIAGAVSPFLENARLRSALSDQVEQISA